jgi:hypothetical protein
LYHITESENREEQIGRNIEDTPPKRIGSPHMEKGPPLNEAALGL